MKETVLEKPTFYSTTNAPRRQLTWFDSTSIIVGTIIGAGIYNTPSTVAGSVSTPSALFGLWMLGGLFSLCGAMCYAELSSMFPRTGGDFVYLNKAYGAWAGFLFGWLQMLVIRPGDISIIAFLFATYFQASINGGNKTEHDWTSAYAALAVLVLTIVNILGLRQSKRLQNFLTTLKVLGLLGIVVLAWSVSPQVHLAPSIEAEPSTSIPISVALIFVLFTYGGWNEIAYLSAEVKHPEHNLVRAFVSGTIVVTLLYVLINGAFLRVLGLPGMSHSSAIATDTAEVLLPNFGGKLVSILICISTLGTVNGMILAGSRIGYAMGNEHPTFGGLGHWDPRTGTPIFALIVQAAITIILILLLGSFGEAILYTSAAVYTFYLATGLAVPVLRKKLPEIERPYRVTLYPLPLIVFGAICTFLIYSAIVYKPMMATFVGALAMVGLVVYWLENRWLASRTNS